MKTRIYKSLVLAMACWFAGCTDLEEKPVGLLAPESLFNSASDVETAIFGAYGWIASERLYGRQFVTAIMLRGDMVDIGDRGTPAERQQVNDFNMDDNNGMVRSFWPYWYQVIGAANAAISGAESLDLQEEVNNRLVAEARFVRAFSYYHLVRVFGDIPYIDYFINDPEAVKDISKTSSSEVYQGILADLEFAKQWLPDNQPNNVRSRPTKGTAASYLASVHLTLADYPKAYEEAKWVIENKGRFGYELEADYQDLFRAEIADNLNEPIFTLDFLGQQNGGGGANDDIMPPMTGIRGADQLGWSVCVPSMAVYNTWDDRDYRKSVSFQPEALINGVMEPYTEFANTQRPHIAKYRMFPGNSNSDGRYSDHNYAAMRYAEVLLIAAEAAAEVNGGPTAEAIGYVNDIRERARNAGGIQNSFPEDLPDGLSKEGFIDAVLDERRLELSFEYKRWYDIKRRQLGQEVFNGPESLEPHPNFDPSRDYLMPLPRIELDVNPNLAPQNPGY
ncbi:Starch-binding associating with outer membrane [Cyclobacterium lianum]|uniref:Starch-binding associating with outer membrane n=1 Tax=Cyclobacterium lianum TaxID=388280 RepID=A0A1M7PEF5_9BACT|nr:RagB/SusD family nutrient uptake outer membrane protein [Cyclobacterium lianum]SHN15420.1 Starch-binding associating with outer membrane [Cyclobacterium lianum]